MALKCGNPFTIIAYFPSVFVWLRGNWINVPFINSLNKYETEAGETLNTMMINMLDGKKMSKTNKTKVSPIIIYETFYHSGVDSL